MGLNAPPNEERRNPPPASASERLWHGRSGAKSIPLLSATPSATWLSPDVQELQSGNRLIFITLAEHFEAIDSGEPSFPVSTAMRSTSPAPAKVQLPALHPQPGWRWDMVRIEVAAAARLILSCDGRWKEFIFPK